MNKMNPPPNGGEPLPEHYIEAERSLVDRALRTLKHQDAFAVFDAYGDVGTVEDGPEGLYFQDTRFLSHYEFLLEKKRPLLLSSVVLDDNAALAVDCANPDIRGEDGNLRLPKDSIFAARKKFLRDAVCFERFSMRNFAACKERFSADLIFGADFHDLFEVRGERRPARGTTTVSRISDREIRYVYMGLDGLERTTTLCFSPTPAKLDTGRASWNFELEPNGRAHIVVTVTCRMSKSAGEDPSRYADAYRHTRRAMRARVRRLLNVSSSNALFNAVMSRSIFDLNMLFTETKYGPYPYAGVPWFSTVFGRDGIITAMEVLWCEPEVARGVLRVLAKTQATKSDPAADSQPGKILHELRGGEMARLGEVPFREYYGTVDATPLFVMLAGMYFERTGDLETVREIWPNILAAIRWIDEFGDLDGDGFVEYARETEQGLANQGWKDSNDSVFHADGRLARAPIALVEVQAYVHAAKRHAGVLARALGEDALAAEFDAAAETLRAAFEKAFWDEELGTYAEALDGEKQPCRIRTSNAGHALFTGTAAPDRAGRVTENLMSEATFTGWGIRTVSASEARYNPMSYHNGSIWPHDNALCAMGMARYGHKRQAAKVLEGLFETAAYQDFNRLPELFCGFARKTRRGPTAYPVACSPQAWAAAAPFALLAACMGIEVDHAADCVRFSDPILPSFLDFVILRDFEVRDSRLTLRLYRYGDDVMVNVMKRSGPARVILMK
ncbi:amylo-alpha-1,6-glucosidase [Caulobacter sp. 17J65-9]|uniref:amylo-alpha-1,6-glucosidase n=1 Tax=Caulobacter sp. 17J65-9 TaxID=2709382 RepID=UPI0013CC4B2A|nr:amylo-alpha-1,6-glucosidase [Caulobacter sp. 17J65-9]NEX93927.1 amylo-alpha-1,6-glucosidase [Caulobacter sp. 17J65-9]